MHTKLRKIGNSQGIILPQIILNMLNWHLKDEITFKIKNDKIIIEKLANERVLKAKDIRKNWLKKIKHSDNTIELNNNFDDIEDWEWN